MRIFYVDPGLRTDVGHHANYCRYIVGELRARGIETPVFAHRNIEPALQAELAAVPHFRVDTYAESDGDPICGWLSGFDAFTRTTYQDLVALPPVVKSDVVLATSVRPVQVSALLEWRRTVPPERQPTIVMESVGTGLRVESTAEGLITSVPDPRSDPRATLFRFVAKRMPPQAEGRFHVVTFGARPSELFSKLLERPVRTLPLPYGRVTPLRSRVGARPVTVAILGHQKYQKGYDRLPEIAAELLKSRGDFRLLIQHVDTRGPPELQQAMRTIAKESDRVTLDENAAGRTGWPRMLELSDLILCPHRPEFYVAGFSSVTAEALANGIPLVVPRGTPLETLLAEFGGPGTSFERFDPAAIAAATSQALDDFDRYAGLAHAAAQRWPERHGPARMVDALLAVVAD